MRLILLAAAPLALAACDSGKTVKAENASIAEVAEAARGVVKFEPGKWENTVSFVDVDMNMPDTPPQLAEMMKKQMAAQSNKTTTSCVTQEMADKPGAGMFTGRNSDQCRWERFAMGGGKIDAVMVCKGAQGQGEGVRMAMVGNFTPTTYDTTSEMKMAMPGGAAGAATQMTIKTKMAGKRVGACDAPNG